MPKPSREHPKPWAVQETGKAFRVTDAHNHVLAEIPFATGLGRGLTRDEARRMADRMVQAGDALTLQDSPSADGQTG